MGDREPQALLPSQSLSFKFLGFPFSPGLLRSEQGSGSVFDLRSSAFGSFRHGIIEPCLKVGMS
jgi:hypothetical protein